MIRNINPTMMKFLRVASLVIDFIFLAIFIPSISNGIMKVLQYSLFSLSDLGIAFSVSIGFVLALVNLVLISLIIDSWM